MPVIDLTPHESNREGESQASALLDEYRDSVFAVTRLNWTLGIIPTGMSGGVGFAVRQGTENGHSFCDVATVNHAIAGLNGTPWVRAANGEVKSAPVLDQNVATGVALLRIKDMDGAACKPIPLEIGIADGDSAVKVSANEEKWTADFGKYLGDSSRKTYGFSSRYGEDLNQTNELFQINGSPGDSGAPVIKLNGKAAGLTEGGKWGTMIAVPSLYIQESLDKTVEEK